jgi:hypothetical protein
VTNNAYIFGQFLWTGIDYLGEAGPWPSRGSSAGLIDLTGAVKPRGHFREALWSARPVIYLGTQRARNDARPSIDAPPLWNCEAGARVRVSCYTNAAKVRLLLNGAQVGDDQPRDRETGVIAWELPFEPGRLEAVGFDDGGREMCRTHLQTSGAPAAMIVSAGETLLERNRGVAIVALQIVDDNGVPATEAVNEITCAVEGPARLLGLEAGNMRDVSNNGAAARHAFHGRLVAIIQATGAAGAVRVRFTTPGLPDAVLALTAQ